MYTREDTNGGIWEQRLAGRHGLLSKGDRKSRCRRMLRSGAVIPSGRGLAVMKNEEVRIGPTPFSLELPSLHLPALKVRRSRYPPVLRFGGVDRKD